MLKNCKRGFNGDYGVKLTPDKLRTFCKIDWPAFGAGWPSEGSLEKVIVNRGCEVILGKLGHPDQFPYIDCRQDAVLSRPTWLNLHPEEAGRVMVARVAAASTCRENCKKLEKPILVGDPEGTPPPYGPLYPPLPPPSKSSPPPSEGEAASDGKAPEANTLTRPGPGGLETATTPPPSGPVSLMLALNPQSSLHSPLRDWPLGSTRSIRTVPLQA
jgi:hypothetical protein